MILQALTQYYQRKVANGSDIAPQGFEKKQIPFIIVIDKQGHFVHLEDTRGSDKHTKKGNWYLMPLANTRSGKNSYQTTNILWDHYGYVLAQPKAIDGINKKSEQQIEKETQSNLEMASAQHNTFKNMVPELSKLLADDESITAVLKFLDNPEQIQAVKDAENWKDCQKVKGCNLTFKLKGEVSLICQSEAIQNIVKNKSLNSSDDNANDASEEQGICLITGRQQPIARLHQPIGGVNAKPAPFASINLDAFESYGKTQGYGFPVSESAMFEYTTALNSLLASDNRFRLGEVTAVCWSEKPTPKESTVSLLFNSNFTKDNPDDFNASVKQLYSSFHHGAYTEPDAEQKMYVLGLSPNSARIVVRFWIESTIADMSTNIKQWFDDIQMVRGSNSPYPEYMPLLRLLCNLVLEGKVDNLPPNMVADTTKSILTGTPIPLSVLQMAIRRNRAEQKVTHARACLIRASLNRSIRYTQKTQVNTHISPLHKEISMSYDPDRTEIGYILGALFATLEKIQEESADSGKINATIRDRYFGSASSTPITVFGTLIKLAQNHLSKLEKNKKGLYVNRNKELSAIIANIESFPSHLSIEQQGLFAIGYYHKRQDFFTSNEEKNKQTDNE